MDREKVGYREQGQHPEKKVFGIITFAVAVMVFSITVFILNFKNLEWGTPTDWATFATYFAGISTPIVGLCSALLFFRSIIVQRDEFEKTRNEMQEATKTQLAAEKSRIKVEKQKHFEHVVPLIEGYRKNVFARLSGFRKGANGLYLSGEEYSSKYNEVFCNYCINGMHSINAINEYLDNDGSIYVAFEWIKNLEEEFSDVTSSLDGRNDESQRLYKRFEASLFKLNDRRNTELNSRIGIKTPVKPGSSHQ